MSTLLSRPLLIDQDDHTLQIPDGRLENMPDPNAPHPLSAVILQAELGLYVSPLFQKLGSDSSVKLTLDIEDALEKWMGTFPAALRDHRPDTRWDQKYPNIPFMRCQLNVIAYCYLLAPLKPYLLGTADREVMGTQLGRDLRAKAVDTCLDLLRASEKFYDLIFPASIKYFFIIFFLFDAATVVCSALVHDTDQPPTLPKRGQCVRALRTAQELMDGVAHLSETARISSHLLRKLMATLPLTASEKQVLGVGLALPLSTSTSSSSNNKKPRIESDTAKTSSAGDGAVAIAGEHEELVLGRELLLEELAQNEYHFSNMDKNNGGSSNLELHPHQTYVGGGGNNLSLIKPGDSSSSTQPTTSASTSYDITTAPQQPPPPYAVAAAPAMGQPLYQYHHQQIPIPPISKDAAGVGVPMQPQWPGMNYSLSNNASALAAQQPSPMMGMGGGGVQMVSMQPGDPLTGTFLEPLWDWEHLNMDLSAYSMPHYGP